QAIDARGIRAARLLEQRLPATDPGIVRREVPGLDRERSLRGHRSSFRRAACLARGEQRWGRGMMPAKETWMPTLHDFDQTTIDGKPKRLADFKGQAALIVNVASRCGLTPQYAALEKLHETYAARGLAVLGFPCNQFGAQEPGSEAEIAQFC